MVTLTKDLKVRLLKAIKDSELIGSEFPEFAGEFMASPITKAEARERLAKINQEEGWHLG